MRCNKRIVIVADRVETYCQLELGHDPKRPCSITREQLKQLYPPARQIAGGKDELCGPARVFDTAEHPAPLSAQLSRVDSVKIP